MVYILQGQAQQQTKDRRLSDKVAAVILSVPDVQAVGVSPEDGRIVPASEIDTTSCLDYTEMSSAMGAVSDPNQVDKLLVTQSYTGPIEQQPNRRLHQLQQPQPDKKQAGLTFALQAATQRDPEVDVYNACAKQTTIVMTKLPTIKLLVKVSSLVSHLPENAVNIENGRLMGTPQDLSCPIAPCPYVQGAWNVFEVRWLLKTANQCVLFKKMAASIFTWFLFISVD